MEGGNGAFDAAPQGPKTFKEIPLNEGQQSRVHDRLNTIASDLERAVSDLKKSRATVGDHLAIGLTRGNPTTLEEALVSAGETLSGRKGTGTRVPDNAQSPYHTVTDFSPTEIGRVHEEILDAKMAGNDPTNTRFVGTLELLPDGWKLGVIDTLTNTSTSLDFGNQPGAVPQEAALQPA